MIKTRFFLLCIGTIFALNAGFAEVLSAQNTGTLSGLVLDESDREAVIGASVRLEGTMLGAATDIDGRYIIRNIPAGTYTVIFNYVGYAALSITEVEITAGGRHELNALIRESTLHLDAITVSASRQRNTDASLIQDIRRTSQIVTGVSGQQIARSQDSNAAQVMQRIPGVTIVDSRFVMIRGLSERYNSVMINNVQAPSTEIDKRTFSFDLISSGSLDRMLISKSGSAELPGDFAGGVIKLYTVEQTEENFSSFSLGLGYRPGTTGRTYMQSAGSRTDFLGFDNGFRRLPSDFPDTRALQSSPRNAELRRDAALTLPNNFMPESGTALADHSVGIGFGRNWQSGRRNWSNITTIDYGTGYEYYERSFFRYLEWEDRSRPILQRFAYNDDTWQKETRLSLMSNFTLRSGRDHVFRFKNLYNQIGENTTIIRRGTDFIQRPDDELQNYMLGYRSRSIYTGQLEGAHTISDNAQVNWTAGLSYLGESEPDLRRFRTFRANGDLDSRFTMQMPPSSNLFDTGRYYGELDEISLNQGADFTLRLPGLLNFVKTGYLVDYRDRDFSSRYMSYLYPGFFNPETREELIRLPLDEVFAAENIRTLDGFVLEEGTRPIDSYTASNLTTAGYITTELPVATALVSAGLRVEHNRQTLNSRDDFQVIRVDNNVLSALPFLNISLPVTDRSQIRTGYSRTVNRPEFRELAPFVFYDYKLDANRAGNPNLRTARIDNAEMRFEYYPRLGEIMTLGVFFKYFDSPIENRTIVTTESPQFSYVNADYAVSYGAEAEFRKSFSGVTGSELIDRFSVSANATIIFSEVDLGESALAQESTRALQGQSPYILNGAIYYDDQRRRVQAGLVYNIVGPRIFSVGDVLFPTIYEMPRHSADINATVGVSRISSVKLGVKNFLNAPFRFYQDSDRNGRANTDNDDVVFRYTTGPEINLSWNVRF
ncbi:MAG: TonB-dependent receptor [Balneolia bacterium]|nr:TonB-dependent receptor [Balneolia bacterium]